ncbi:5'-nucleotidase SurE [Zea mays]|uniref:5'-nucleotidase SurE n=1 Tax=Zea mays TaxID=4577 RepID=A0A317YHH5_MAIZE|nr:5'-nucleotidase SurE [Zea mays]
MVQSFKGILADRSEGEIYATLCDCGMDPDIAVDRLISQDLFEVVEPSKKGRYLTKKRLKLQRKRIKNERKEANKNDQQSIMRKGKKIKQKFLKAKARLKYKIEKVINGINKRPNCGYEMFHSSVITAARKALVYVIPSIAISLNWYM